MQAKDSVVESLIVEKVKFHLRYLERVNLSFRGKARRATMALPWFLHEGADRKMMQTRCHLPVGTVRGCLERPFMFWLSVEREWIYYDLYIWLLMRRLCGLSSSLLFAAQTVEMFKANQTKYATWQPKQWEANFDSKEGQWKKHENIMPY